MTVFLSALVFFSVLAGLFLKEDSEVTTYAVLENLPVEEVNENESRYISLKYGESDFGNPANSLKWYRMPITYSYSEGCVGPIIFRIEKALAILSEQTKGAVRMEKVEEDSDLLFKCYKEQRYSPDAYYTSTQYTLGSNTRIEVTSEDLIKKMLIEFWGVTNTTYPQSCYSFPKLELHEILHAFGYEHNTWNRYSIMYPQEEGCIETKKNGDNVTIRNVTFVPKDEIDSDIVNDLINIYS